MGKQFVSIESCIPIASGDSPSSTQAKQLQSIWMIQFYKRMHALCFTRQLGAHLFI